MKTQHPVKCTHSVPVCSLSTDLKNRNTSRCVLTLYVIKSRICTFFVDFWVITSYYQMHLILKTFPQDSLICLQNLFRYRKTIQQTINISEIALHNGMMWNAALMNKFPPCDSASRLPSSFLGELYKIQVLVDGYSSSLHNAGLPQGSARVPTTFLIHINLLIGTRVMKWLQHMVTFYESGRLR